MKFFYQYPIPDAEKIHDVTSKAYGIKNPERINGYAGAFLFRIPDVYVSDKISQRIDTCPWFADILMDMLKRFSKDDYGFVTQFESDNNCETRYFGFSSSWMIGRYGTRLGGIVLETFHDISLFYFSEEDVSLIWKQQELKSKGYSNSEDLDDMHSIRVNEMQYIPYIMC